MADTSHNLDRAGRRDALKKIALGGIGAGTATAFPILGQSAPVPDATHSAHAHSMGQAAGPLPLTGPDWKPLFFDEHQNNTVIALTDLIIPETDTPGAKTALANRFIDLLLSDENPDQQKRFYEGLAWIDGRSLKLHGKPFVELSADQQTALLTPLADSNNKSAEDEPGVHFFQSLKDVTIYAYYTSQPGLEKELQYGGDDYHTEFPGACNHPEHQT